MSIVTVVKTFKHKVVRIVPLLKSSPVEQSTSDRKVRFRFILSYL